MTAHGSSDGPTQGGRKQERLDSGADDESAADAAQESETESITSLIQGGNSDSIIINRDLLTPTYVVSEEHIVGRGEQKQLLIDELQPVLNRDSASNLLIYGPSGTGKTLITKAVLNGYRDVAETEDIAFGAATVNCREPSTYGDAVYRIAAEFAQHAGVSVGCPQTGISTSAKEDALWELLDTNYQSAVIVLDEIDKLTGRQDRTEPAFSRLLYMLSEASSRKTQTSITIVAITNDTRVKDQIGSRAWSRFTPKDIPFNDYGASQLRKILHRRTDAFRDGVVGDGVIQLIAAFAAKDHGDARQAIDMLRKAGEIVEDRDDSVIIEAHARLAKEKATNNRVYEMVRGCSPQKKLSLYAATAVASVSDDDAARTKSAYKVYQYITDELDIDEHHYDTVLTKLKELTTYSIVESRQMNTPNGGYKKWTFEEDPEKVLAVIEEDDRLSGIHTESALKVAEANIDTEANPRD